MAGHISDTDNEIGNMSPCLIKCCIWSQDLLLVTLWHLAQHIQLGLWVGSQDRGGAAGLVLGMAHVMGAGSLGKLAAQTAGLRCFRQQLRELDHGFKLSHSWMLSKSCSWYWNPLFWSCFRLRRCLTCSGPAFWWHNSTSALSWLVESSVMLKWILLTLKPW